MTDHQFVLADGRRLGISVVGDPTSSRIVIVSLPTPGSGSFDPDPAVTAALPLRLIFVDRPGYGGSDPLPRDVESSVDGFADDIAAYLRAMDHAREGLGGGPMASVGVVGWSFGGLVALAFAARHPDLVDAVAVVAAPSPKHLNAGERYSRVAELRKHGVERRRDSLESSLAEDGRPDITSLGIRENDGALEPLGTENRIGHMLDSAWTQNAAGIASDRMAIRDGHWAKQLADVRAPTMFVYGDDDAFVGPTDAKWFARHVPGARVEHVPAATHAVIVSEWRRILDHVAERGGQE